MGLTNFPLSETRTAEAWSGGGDSRLHLCREDGQPSVRVLMAVEELEELRAAWSAWSDGPQADLDFFSIRLHHKREAARPHVIVVNRNGRPDCLLVGWLGQGEVSFKVGSFTLFRSDARILRFVNGGFLGNQSRENSEILVREIVRSLRRGEAHAAEFSQLNVQSPLYDWARREPNILCRDRFTPFQSHWYLALAGGFDTFLRGLSSHRRKQLAKRARMLAKDFPVRFESVRSEHDVEDFARKADEIAQKTYRHALGVGFVNNLETREVLCAAARKSALRASVLYVGERPIAFTVGILSGKTLYGTFTGYDPEFDRYSPGMQSLMRLLEESFEEKGGPWRYDSGCGDFSYKRALFDSSWRESPVWIFAPSLKGLHLHIHKEVSTLLHFLAMQLLAKSGSLRQVKKMWQQQGLLESLRHVISEDVSAQLGHWLNGAWNLLGDWAAGRGTPRRGAVGPL
jgi:hypothetical protein